MDLVNILIYLVVVGLVFWLLWWFINYVGLPEPFSIVARAILALVAVIMLIRLLTKATGISL